MSFAANNFSESSEEFKTEVLAMEREIKKESDQNTQPWLRLGAIFTSSEAAILMFSLLCKQLLTGRAILHVSLPILPHLLMDVNLL